MKNKLLLVDCDGVLLHWEWSFDMWMKKHGFTKIFSGQYNIHEAYKINQKQASQLIAMFNETVYVASLPPYLDAIKYVRKLHEDHGVVLHVITSIGDTPEVVNCRTANLKNVFGSSPFYKITCLDPSISKLAVLNEYADSGCYWIEDHPGNFELGAKIGLRSLLMDQHYNSEFQTDDRVYSWKHVYERLTS